MLPAEKALVKRLEKEPFALIGINTDGNLEQLKGLLEKQGVTWRNAWEGAVPSGAGPLARAWEVTQFPTMYVLDVRGVIRAQDPVDLDQAVDALVAEAKASSNR
jgi:hypothetical protein